MKKLILTLLMLLPLWVSAQGTAELPNTLLVTLASGSTQEYPLLSSPEISFSGTDMIINTGKANVVITRDNITRYEFIYVNYASVESVTSENNIVRRGNEVFISNVSSGTPITLHTVDGRILQQLAANSRGEAAVSLDNLRRGIYLLTVNRFTTKIVKQ